MSDNKLITYGEAKSLLSSGSFPIDETIYSWCSVNPVKIDGNPFDAIQGISTDTMIYSNASTLTKKFFFSDNVSTNFTWPKLGSCAGWPGQIPALNDGSTVMNSSYMKGMVLSPSDAIRVYNGLIIPVVFGLCRSSYYYQYYNTYPKIFNPSDYAYYEYCSDWGHPIADENNYYGYLSLCIGAAMPTFRIKNRTYYIGLMNINNLNNMAWTLKYNQNLTSYNNRPYIIDYVGYFSYKSLSDSYDYQNGWMPSCNWKSKYNNLANMSYSDFKDFIAAKDKNYDSSIRNCLEGIVSDIKAKIYYPVDVSTFYFMYSANMPYIEMEESNVLSADEEGISENKKIYRHHYFVPEEKEVLDASGNAVLDPCTGETLKEIIYSEKIEEFTSL